MKILPTIAILLLSGSMTAANIYTRTPKGVTVAVKKHHAGQTALVRLQVLGEKIIRVSATAENSFADPKSLIIVPRCLFCKRKGRHGDCPDKILDSKGEWNNWRGVVHRQQREHPPRRAKGWGKDF